MKKLSVLFTFLALASALNGQTITYKANKWGNTKLHKRWTTALDNPVLEKVVIVQTEKTFEITFGGKRSFSYAIVGFETLRSTSVKYIVKTNGKRYFITVSFIDNAYFIICENEWVVSDITDISSTKEAKSLKTLNEPSRFIDTSGKDFWIANSFTCEQPYAVGQQRVKFIFGKSAIYIDDRSGFQTYKIQSQTKNEWGSTIFNTLSKNGNPHIIKVMKSQFGDTALQTISINNIVITYTKEN